MLTTRDLKATADFRPLPFFHNAHLQTLLGHLWRGSVPADGRRERQVVLGDGDRLILHDYLPRTWRPGRPVALLVHGLAGCYLSGAVQRTAGLLLRQGIRVVCVDLRGAGRGAALARRTYNGGCSEDVRSAAAEIRSWAPTSPLTLVGFSLGGNIVLKLAGEAASRPVPGLARVAALAPPVDLEQCAALIALPANRLYERHFVHSLVQQVRRQQRFFPELSRSRFPQGLTLRLFDDLYTAPRGGFADALDYYRRSSSLPLLPQINVPALILAARDDPFVAVEPLESLPHRAPLQVRITTHGGHLGFIGPDGVGGFRWAERQVADWVARQGR